MVEQMNRRRRPSQHRDSVEKRELCEKYLEPERCVGTHFVLSGETCWKCGSTDFKRICHLERIREEGTIEEFIEEAAGLIESYEVIK